MNKNRIRRTASNLDLQSLIRRCDIEFDERARYVEFVCSVWNEGRFGPDLAEPVTINWDDRTDLDPTACYGLSDDGQNGPATCDALPPLGRVGYQKTEAAFRRAKFMGLLAASANGGNITGNSSSNQGRGSPRLPKPARAGGPAAVAASGVGMQGRYTQHAYAKPLRDQKDI